jgi:hypothetical protein
VVRRCILTVLAALAPAGTGLLLAPLAPLAAQDGGPGATCEALVGDAQLRERCFAVAQTAESLQPQLGILIGGGNPILGTAGTGGLRLGTLPRIDISPRLNLTFVRLPDILAVEAGGTIERLNRTLGIPAPAVGATAAVGLFPGLTLAPGLSGLGSVDLLVGATALVFALADTDGFTGTPLAWSAGVRLGLLRESFVVPAASLSVLHRRQGRTTFGRVCDGEEQAGVCHGRGDMGEVSFNLQDWSTRFAVSKRVLGFGVAGGVGYDRLASDLSYAVRTPLTTTTAQIVHSPDLDLRSDRWSVFGNLGYTFLLSSVVVEGGWMQGDSPIHGFIVRGFDPRDGTWFVSIGGRIGI